MCLFKIRVRGVKVCGRQMYRTDDGIRLGYNGPTVSLESALSELAFPLANSVRDNIAAIDAKIASGEINVTRYNQNRPYPLVTVTDPQGPWYADENPGLNALSMTPPDAACREYERADDYYPRSAGFTDLAENDDVEEIDFLAEAENDPVTGYKPEVIDCPF